MIIEFVKKNKIFVALLVVCILILVFKKRNPVHTPPMLDYPKKPYMDVINPYNNVHRKQITKELVDLLNDSEDDYYKGASSLNIKDLLTKSIAKARKINPNPKYNPFLSLHQYINYVNKYAGLLPNFDFQNPHSITGKDILDGLCAFYFVVDQPLDELKGHTKGLKNALQYYPPFAMWMYKFSQSWGKFLDSFDSWNDEIYQKIYNAPDMGMQTGWYGKGNIWRTWNEWFSRVLICPGKSHPITAPNDDTVVVSPADSISLGVWKIGSKSEIGVTPKGHVGHLIKLIRYYNANDLLLPNSKFKDVFANGYLTHAFLNVSDYHRYHYAVRGKVVEHGRISQHVSLDVKWDAKNKRYIPIDSTGWQFTQTRAYVIVETPDMGYVALIPMGMAQVSSTNITYPIYTHHDKGDGLGNFLFGGSDFIMLFQEGTNFKLTVPRNKDGTYKHRLMGQEYGRVTPISKKVYNPKTKIEGFGSLFGW